MRLRSAIVVPALLAFLLAGCGASVDGTASSEGSAPTTTAPTTSAAPTTTAAPSTTAPTSSPAPVPAEARATPKASTATGALLPWPTAAPARLQSAADGGAQPWLLDPSDLANSYVSATYGWTNADATAEPGGTAARTRVDVRNTDGARRTLTCAQPGRKGAGGIWLVTADTTV